MAVGLPLIHCPLIDEVQDKVRIRAIDGASTCSRHWFGKAECSQLRSFNPPSSIDLVGPCLALVATRTPLPDSSFGPKKYPGSPERHKYSPSPPSFLFVSPRHYGTVRICSTASDEDLFDIGSSIKTLNMFGFGKEKAPATGIESASDTRSDALTEVPKSRWERLWPVMACGAGLFSDGYINNVCLVSLNPNSLY